MARRVDSHLMMRGGGAVRATRPDRRALAPGELKLVAAVCVGAPVAGYAAASAGSPLVLLMVGAAACLPFVYALAPAIDRILLALILLDLPLQLSTRPGFDPSLAITGTESGLSISLATVGLAGLYAMQFARAMDRRRSAGRSIGRHLLPLGVYVALSGASIAVAENAMVGGTYLVQMVETTLLFAYLVATTRSVADFQFVAAVLLAGVALEGFFISATDLLGLQITLPGIESVRAAADADPLVSRRIGGTLGGPNVAASYLTALLPLALAVALASGTGWLRRTAVLALATGIPALAITGSRTGLVVLVASLAVVTAVARRRGLISARVVLAGVVAFLCLLAPTGSIVLGRIGEDDNGSTSARFAMVQLGLKMIADRPFTGVGLNNVSIATPRYAGPDLTGEFLFSIHNKYLLVAAESGLLALAAYLVFLASALRLGFRAARAPDGFLAFMATGLVVGLGAQLAFMTVEVFASRPQTQLIWILAALLVAAGLTSRDLVPAVGRP